MCGAASGRPAHRGPIGVDGHDGTEAAPGARVALDVNAAAVAGHDCVGDAQPEPAAPTERFGREERVEDATEDLGRDADAVVPDLDDDLVGIAVGGDRDPAI